MASKLETRFERELMRELEALLPGCYIFKLDSAQYQGIPDRLILFKDTWVALECKESRTAAHRPNQDYHVEVMNNMAFAAFVYPENREEIIDEVCRTFGVSRYPRVSKR